MAKLSSQKATTRLSDRERILLFCVASRTNWQKTTGVTGETLTALIVKGLTVRDALGRLALTSRGHAALRELLPGL